MADSIYTIAPGDNLSAIAAKNNTTVGALASYNKIANPNLIQAGGTLKIPSSVIPVTPTAPVIAPPSATGIPTPPAPVTPTLAPDDPSYKFNTATGQPNPKYVAPVSTVVPTGTTPATGIPTGTPSAADIASAETAAFGTPSQSSTQVYNDAYNASGLGDIKAKMNDLDAQILAKQNQRDEALGTVNENPFLDEKTRVGRGANITNTANAEIANLNSAKTNLNNLYTSGLSEVNGVVSRNSADFSANQSTAQAKLTFLQTQAEQAATAAEQTKKDTAQAAQDAKTSPTVIGDATVGFYRWDPSLGKFVQTIAPAPKTAVDKILTPTQANDYVKINPLVSISAGDTVSDANKAVATANQFNISLKSAVDANGGELDPATVKATLSSIPSGLSRDAVLTAMSPYIDSSSGGFLGIGGKSDEEIEKTYGITASDLKTLRGQ